MTKRLVIIDSFSLANRAFFALPILTTSSGQPTNAVYGLAMMLLKLLEESKPDYFIAAFDVAAPTFRHQEYQEYKAQRMKMEDALKSQIPLIRELLGILEIPIYESVGFEADDVIGTIASKASAQGIEVEIVTGDKDSFQLVNPKVRVLYTRKGITDVDVVDEEYIAKRYQLKPKQLIDLKGLMGDSSDNIPGITGFGEKTSLKYLHQYHSLDEIYEHLDEISRERERRLLETYKEQAFLSRHLATIKTDLPIDLELNQCCRHRNFDRERLLNFCQEYQFKSLVKKLGGDTEATVSHISELSYSIKILDDDQLPWVAQKIKAEKYCLIQFLSSEASWRGVEWLGLGIGVSGENWLLPLAEKANLPSTLLEILDDTQITKCGHDLKKQMMVAKVKGISINGPLEDVLIAGYLLNAGIGSLELEELTQTYLQKTIPFGTNDRGARVSPFDLSPKTTLENLERLAGARLESIRQLNAKFKQLLVENCLENLYYDVELPLVRVLWKMEETGVKVNPEILQNFGDTLKKRQQQLEEEIYQLTGAEFNISSPKQLGNILYDQLGLTPPKKTKTGYSTDAAVLESLIGQHPVIPLLLEYRQNIKLQTTYIDSLINLINPKTGRVHTTFNQAVTTTGRLSSTEPNLQNIPIRSEEGRMIRHAFIPGENEFCLLAADYSQIELRVMAHFSGDHAYREAFLNNEDIHQFTAAAVYGVAPKEVTPQMRDHAKAVNFGIIYGISGFGLAQNIGVTRKEADGFIKAYFEKYPGVKAYVEQLVDKAREAGESRTLLGRIRKLPDLHSRNFTLRSFAERMARNTPIQGTAADIIKVAMVRIGKHLDEKPSLGRLLLQVHDELIFEVHQDYWKELARVVKEEMEQAVSLEVPLVVDFKMGTDWGSLNKVHLEES